MENFIRILLESVGSNVMIRRGENQIFGVIQAVNLIRGDYWVDINALSNYSDDVVGTLHYSAKELYKRSAHSRDSIVIAKELELQ